MTLLSNFVAQNFVLAISYLLELCLVLLNRTKGICCTMELSWSMEGRQSLIPFCFSF